MRFRVSLAFLIAATSCQPDSGDFEADGLVGRPPRQFSTPDLWRGNGTDSRLEPDKGRLTIVYDSTTSYSKRYNANFYQPRTLYRFRLSDNLALDRSEIDEKVHVVPTPKKIFLLYGSVLGKAELRGYGGTPERHVLKGYNLDIMRERYRDP